MNIIHTFILGIVEGVTEFLPISSTFHLIIATDILGIFQTDAVKLFQVTIQGGAILAVLGIFGKEFFSSRKKLINIAFSFVPTMIVGFLLHKIIKDVFFEARFLTETIFLLVGLVFIIFERYDLAGKNEKKLIDINPKQAITIGLAQSLAVVPGVSRAGAVMLAMMMMGFERKEAAKYSFILAVPTILAASLFDMYQMRDIFQTMPHLSAEIVLGSVVAFFSALIAVRWLIGFLQNHNLMIFGWYRVIIGLLLLVFSH